MHWRSYRTMQSSCCLYRDCGRVCIKFCFLSRRYSRRLRQRFFKYPLPRIISWLSVCIRAIPTRVMAALLFPDWPSAQLQVLRAFLNSPASIYASLSMAHEEMTTIRDLDVQLLQEHRHKVHLYFAEFDNWVDKQKDTVLRAFDVDEGNFRVVHGHKDIPHAFCISK